MEKKNTTYNEQKKEGKTGQKINSESEGQSAAPTSQLSKILKSNTMLEIAKNLFVRKENINSIRTFKSADKQEEKLCFVLAKGDPAYSDALGSNELVELIKKTDCIEINKGLYVNRFNVTSVKIISTKEKKEIKILFNMEFGEPVYSDVFATSEEALACIREKL